MPEGKKPTKGQTQQRTINAQIRTVDESSRTVELSFSSELPVQRWYGAEILSHDEEAVDLSRLLDVGTVLFNHGRDSNVGKMPIAKIEKAWIDTQERKGKAEITFDDDEDSDKIFQKINKGMLKGVSVGYSVSSWEEVMAGKQSANGRFTGPCEVAIRWGPLEISIEPTPADPSVGIGRSTEEEVTADGRTDILNSNKEDGKPMDEENRNDQNTHTTEAVDATAVKEEAVRTERQRVSEITALCRDFGIDSTEYINSGVGLDNVRAAVLEKMKVEKKPAAAATNDVRVEQEEADKFRAAACDSIMLRAGLNLEKTAEGARELRGMRLRDLAIECLVRSGETNVHRLSDEQLFREALTPDSQFSGILSNTVNKSMAKTYKAAKTTYQAWTARGSNPDFKGATHYQISEAGELVPMTQSGEFKFDEMNDQGVSKAIATFGRSWGMNRQALINDDIGMLTRLPEAYVRAAGRGINKLVYKMLGTNPKIYDGDNLFHTNHKNMASTGGAIGTDTIGAGRTAMRKQKNLRGKETLNIAPSYLIVPAALETDAQKFLVSISDPNSTNSGVLNVFRNSLSLVVDAELDDYSESTWYLTADPAEIDTIEVTYLNGDDMPKVENQVGFDFLGIKWRIYIDYGVTVLDYRGLYKNSGE